MHVLTWEIGIGSKGIKTEREWHVRKPVVQNPKEKKKISGGEIFFSGGSNSNLTATSKAILRQFLANPHNFMLLD